MNSEHVKIWAGYCAISFIWGSTWLAIKIGMQSVPPFLAVGIRFAIASAILFVIVKVRKVPVPFTAEAKKLYAALALLSYTIPFALVYWSEQFIPSGLGSVLFSVFPFAVAVLSHLFLKDERLNAFKVVGIVFGFVGLLIIFSGDLHWTDSRGTLGMFAMLLVALAQASATIFVKKHGHAVSSFALNLVGMSIGSVALLTLGFATESLGSIVWDRAAVGSILYLAVVGSVVAFVTYYWLLKRVEAVYLSLTSFINPIVALALGALVLNEILEVSMFVGSGFVLLGILIANGKYLLGKITRTT